MSRTRRDATRHSGTETVIWSLILTSVVAAGDLNLDLRVRLHRGLRVSTPTHSDPTSLNGCVPRFQLPSPVLSLARFALLVHFRPFRCPWDFFLVLPLRFTQFNLAYIPFTQTTLSNNAIQPCIHPPRPA